jgi:uncharacterized protein (TIGR03437 family)
MSGARKFDLNCRLDAYFATLRTSNLRDALKQSATNWQLYAAVTGSAMAMVTNASASMIGTGAPDLGTDPMASVRSFQPPPPAAVAANLRPGGTQTQAVGPPVISNGGIVPLFSSRSVIQPGEWVSIYGKNLANGTATWNGDFPTSLGGTSVEINGKPAYLSYVSPTLINLQAPDDTVVGTVSVTVTTAAGTAKSAVSMSTVAPSFSLLDAKKHVTAIILRSNGAGAYGGGGYDLLGPTGTCLGYRTVAAKPGDSLAIFGVGFGPTNPAVPAGEAFAGAAPTTDPFGVYIGGVSVQPTFVGLSSAGLYQINLTVPPGLGQGDVPILAAVGGMQTQAGVLFSLQTSNSATFCTATGGTVGGTGGTGVGIGGTGFTTGGGDTGGTGGGGTGGGGGGGTGSMAPPPGNRPYHPKLRFPAI